MTFVRNTFLGLVAQEISMKVNIVDSGILFHTLLLLGSLLNTTEFWLVSLERSEQLLYLCGFYLLLQVYNTVF